MVADAIRPLHRCSGWLSFKSGFTRDIGCVGRIAA
jgi:hypothetical protein